jgi:hypothetical protein
MIKILKKDSLTVDEQYVDQIISFIQFTSKLLDLKQDFVIYLIGKGQDESATTGGYNRENNTISVLYEGRALIDILRSIAHEIEHQRQNEKGLLPSFPDQPQNIGGFLENDANIIAGILIKLYVKHIGDHNLYWM